ncbi:hypothetical protein [Mucilaginibacter hurinus]|nr:hypothetical protein [Mucilaginibacter hurinus]
METDQKVDNPESFGKLLPQVREKAMEIAATLSAQDIPKGSSVTAEAIRRAEEWFTELEG